MKKASLIELEAAFADLAIGQVSRFLKEPAKDNNRKLDILAAMGKEFLKRGEDGVRVMERLAIHSDPRVKVSIATPLLSVDRPQGIKLLENLTSDPTPNVRLMANYYLDIDKYL
jgi:hypothetical protein